MTPLETFASFGGKFNSYHTDQSPQLKFHFKQLGFDGLCSYKVLSLIMFCLIKKRQETFMLCINMYTHFLQRNIYK
jgi:hypothetical protein